MFIFFTFVGPCKVFLFLLFFYDGPKLSATTFLLQCIWAFGGPRPIEQRTMSHVTPSRATLKQDHQSRRIPCDDPSVHGEKRALELGNYFPC